jgi:hypothetical protein
MGWPVESVKDDVQAPTQSELDEARGFIVGTMLAGVTWIVLLGTILYFVL